MYTYWQLTTQTIHTQWTRQNASPLNNLLFIFNDCVSEPSLHIPITEKATPQHWSDVDGSKTNVQFEYIMHSQFSL